MRQSSGFKAIAHLIALVGFFLCVTPMAIAETSTLPGENPPSASAVQDAVGNLQLSDGQKRSPAAIIQTYQQKQRQAEAAMLYQLKNVMPTAEYNKLVESLSRPTTRAAVADDSNAEQVPVTLTGGFETDPRDHGRPVVLVAAGLAVTPEIFRKAFSGVHPAGPNSGGPTDAEARRNKQALLSVLAPYGVTDDRLNEVSNYYRYNHSAGEMWKHVDASAVA